MSIKAPIKAKAKGNRGESDLLKLIDKLPNVSIKKQPSSGAFGTRIGSKHLQGDLKLSFGETDYRIEVKRRKQAPQVLERWLAGTEILAIRGDYGEWRFYLPEETFLHLLTLASESPTS
jgi:hypothetical protein